MRLSQFRLSDQSQTRAIQVWVAPLFLTAGACLLSLACDRDPAVVGVQSAEEVHTPELMPPPIADYDPDIGKPRRHPSMVLVPAGVFTMGDGSADSYCGWGERTVTLSNDFYFGQYEVTNREYRAALQWAYDKSPRLVTATSSTVQDNLDGSTEELVDLNDWDCEISFSAGTFTVDPGKENYPMIEVSWYGAVRYCDWLSLQSGLPRAYDHGGDWACNGGNPYTALGYRLPTDAEWEYTTQVNGERTYPWGNESPDCSRANAYSGGYCVGSTSEVGSYPTGVVTVSGIPVYDMAGNVWEWCNDWHMCPQGSSEESDPPGPSSGRYRVLRGGAWDYDDTGLRSAYRYGKFPSYRVERYGFRCARSQ